MRVASSVRPWLSAPAATIGSDRSRPDLVRRAARPTGRVLLVEDFATLRQLIRWMLETSGATVVEAGSGREAFELARTETFDVALTDLGLPDMSGAAVVTAIRSASQGRTPVVAVTGAGDDQRAHAIEVGAARAFTKPPDWNELIDYLACTTKAASPRGR